MLLTLSKFQLIVVAYALLLLPLTSWAKTQWVERNIEQTIAVERSNTELHEAIADYYWYHELHDQTHDWTKVSVEATPDGNVIIHVVNAAQKPGRFIINSNQTARIGRMALVRYKDVTQNVTMLVEEQLDPRYDFGLVSVADFVKWDKAKGAHGKGIAYAAIHREVTTRHNAVSLRLVSFKAKASGPNRRQWEAVFETDKAQHLGYQVSVSMSKIFRSYSVNYVRRIF